MVDPRKDTTWEALHKRRQGVITDGVHKKDQIQLNSSPESDSEGVKKLKGEYVVRIIQKHQMEQVYIDNK